MLCPLKKKMALLCDLGELQIIPAQQLVGFMLNRACSHISTLPAHTTYLYWRVANYQHISSKRKLTGRTVSVRVKQQIVANAERNSAHKYNSCTAISRRGVKLTTHKASIQNWEKNYSKAGFTNCGITWGHRRGPQAFLSSVPSQPSSLSWPAGVNPAPF